MRTSTITRASTPAALCVAALVAGLLLQGCDTMQEPVQPSSKSSFQDTYAEVSSAYSEASNAALESIQEGLRDPSNQQSVQALARKGYAQWAERNGADVSAFDRGAEVAQALAQRRQSVARTQSGAGGGQQKTQAAFLDSVLAASDLSTEQQRFVKEIPEAARGASSIPKLQERLKELARGAHDELGEEEAKPVVALAALASSKIKFMYKNADEIAAALRKTKSESSISSSKSRQFDLVQTARDTGYGDESPRMSEPPQMSNYMNYAEVASAGVSLGAGTAIGVGGPAAGVGFSTGGPGGAASAAVIVGGFGYMWGFTTGGFLELLSQQEDYKNAVGRWCNTPRAPRHEEYEELCS